MTGPLLVQYWHLNGRQACANNLRQYGILLCQYGDAHQGQLPQVAEDGPRTYAASFVPTLQEAGLLKKEPPQPVCDPYGRRPGPLPSSGEVEQARDHPELFRDRARQLAGNYAYTLGYRENGTLHGLSAGDCNQPIMADHRPLPEIGSNSPNHGGAGQNVLYIGGNVKWHTTPWAGCPDDDIYLNRNGKVAPGVDCDDAVLAPGEAGPRGN
jgi:hypothetical protein